MKLIFTLNLLLIGFTLSAISQNVESAFPKSLFTDMQLVVKQKKQTRLKNKLYGELKKQSFSLPDTIVTVKQKKLICFKNTRYYEFESIINDTMCLYLMVNKSGNFSLLEGTCEDDDYLFNKIGRPKLITQEQIFEYLTLLTDLQYIESSWELTSSRFRMIKNINNENISEIKDKSLEFLDGPKLIEETNNEYKIQLYLSFDGGIYNTFYTLSKEGEVTLDDENVSLIAHYNYRDRFENGKIVKYRELDFYQDAAIKIENVFKKYIHFTKLNYANKKIKFFALNDTLNFTLIDLSKIDWQETQDTTISEKYMAEFRFDIMDSLKENENFVFLSINTKDCKIVSTIDEEKKPIKPYIAIDRNKYSINIENQIETGKHAITIYSRKDYFAPRYIAISLFSAREYNTNKLLQTLFDLQKQTNK